MKRIIPLLLAMCVLLTGCMCMDGTAEIKEDGTVAITTFTGMTVEAVNEALNSGAELGFEPTTQLVRNGVTYLGEYQTETYDSYEELNEESVYITRNGKSFSMTLTVTAEDMEEFNSMFEGEDSAEVELLLSTMYMNIGFKFPYRVTQTGGPTAGVSIDGNTVAFNPLKLEPGTYSFYAGNTSQFTDVSADAWYFTAVQAMQEGGLVAGYGNGVFGPLDNISLSAICTMLARVDGQTVGAYQPGGYWAEKAIDYCVSQGYIKDYGETVPAVYDRAASREEVVAAIAIAYGGLNETGAYSSSYDTKTIQAKSAEAAETALRNLFEYTGYSVYITGDTSKPVEEVIEEKFGRAVNGVVVMLQQGENGVSNVSQSYYMEKGDTNRAYISSLFSDGTDPFASLEASNYRASVVRAPNASEVNIPDVEDIDAAYLHPVKTAYAMGLCTGVDAQGTFLPKHNITRAEVCQLFYNINWVKPGVS